jgi:ER lumen protein retaining receptor
MLSLVIWCSDLNREWLADFSWTLSMYLEASAMFPQIFMFQKQAATEGGVVEVSTIVLY